MPWSSKQHRLFEAAAHSPSVAKKVGIPQAKASKMAAEGIKGEPQPKPTPEALANALKK